MPDFLAGEVILIDKELKWTSFDVVNKIRYELKHFCKVKQIKVGHAGTLDPLASGLLIICTGKKTKEINTFQGMQKSYSGIIRLGSVTPSYDLESEEQNFKETNHLTEEEVRAAAETMQGEVEQMPPVFSAKKIDGKRAYLAARKGAPIEMKSKLVNIHQFEITKVEGKDLYFKIDCSKGTYIRSIANDLGEKLKVGGHLRALRRTAIGDFNVENAQSIAQFKESLSAIV